VRIRRGRQIDEDALEARHRGMPHRGAVQPPRDAILDLQKRAGNLSVVELLAGRGPRALRVAVQRQVGEEVTTPGEAVPEESTTSTSTLSIPELAAVIPVTTFSLGVRASGGKSSTVERARPTLTIPIEEFQPRLVEAATTGRQFGTMVIKHAGLTLTLRDVVIASCILSPSSTTVTLDAETMERAGE